MDLGKLREIEIANKQRIISLFGDISNDSGIYILTRQENGFRYAYIGQAKHLLDRLVEHLKASSEIFDKNTQHIDFSIRKHGLMSDEYPNGWKIKTINLPIERLDMAEQNLIKEYANSGWQMRNKTAGGQGEGKFEISETRQKKGYRDGLEQGYKNAQREISNLFKKNLTCEISGKPNKNKEKAFQKFKEFIKEK